MEKNEKTNKSMRKRHTKEHRHEKGKEVEWEGEGKV